MCCIAYGVDAERSLVHQIITHVTLMCWAGGEHTIWYNLVYINSCSCFNFQSNISGPIWASIHLIIHNRPLFDYNYIFMTLNCKKYELNDVKLIPLFFPFPWPSEQNQQKLTLKFTAFHTKCLGSIIENIIFFGLY